VGLKRRLDEMCSSLHPPEITSRSAPQTVFPGGEGGSTDTFTDVPYKEKVPMPPNRTEGGTTSLHTLSRASPTNPP
jgi:hypothetical protein